MFDSDFDTSDVQGTTDIDNDIDFLDTTDINSENSDTVETGDEFELSNEIDDDYYHATKMSDDEVARIDEMWNDNNEFTKDIEPYHATKNSAMNEMDIVEPYQATRLDESQDISDGTSIGYDITSAESLEEQFAADIEAMSFDDLNEEQARLDALSQMDDLDIFAEYDISQKEQYDSELFNELTSDLPKDTLEHLKDGLANGNPEVYDYFGLTSENNSESDSEDFARVRKL